MKRRQTRFTLVELLVVITIIAILAGILIPTIATAIKKTHIGKAKAEMNSLMAAISLYQSEYDVMPFAYDKNSDSKPLSDSDYDVLISFLSQTGTDADKNTGNARKIKMLNVKKAATYLDPWDKRYHIVYDCNYNDEIAKADITGFYVPPASDPEPKVIPYTVVICSEGPDETSDSSDPKNKKNRDNLYTVETNWSDTQGHVIP